MTFLTCTLALAAPAEASSLELYPNFHTLGVNVKLNVSDPEKDAWAKLEYGPEPDQLKPGQALSRVDNGHGRLSGCIFWCAPNTTYHVRVTLQDPTTPALHGQTLTGSMTTRAEPAFPAAKKTLYVSPDGKGTAFTRAAPGSLAEGLARVESGERLLLLSGRYFTGNLTLAKSGTEKDPIQIEGVLGGEVVLDGGHVEPLVWRKVGGKEGLYFTETAFANPNLVIADGKRLFPHRMLEDLESHKTSVGLSAGGIVRFDAELDGFYRNPSTNPLLNSNWSAPRRMYVAFRDKSDPNKKKIAVSRQNRGLLLDGKSHVSLRNLTFTHYGVSPAATALWLRNCRDIVLDRCTFAYNDIGILLDGNTERVTLQDSELFDGMAGYFAWKIKATYDDAVPHSAIFPFYGRLLERGGLLYQHGLSGRGIVVRRCRFHDFAQAGHLGPASENKSFAESHEIDFYENQVWNCAEDGLELDADARNVRIWKNTFHHCNAPLSLAVARAGPTYVFRNLFHSITADTFMIHPADGLKTQPGHTFKFQTGDTTSRVGDLFFWHNTVAAGNSAVALDLAAPARWKRFHARNNLFVAEQGLALSVQSFEPFPLDLDYNGYFQTGKGPFGRVRQKSGEAEKEITSATALHALGWEKHGFFGSPGFTKAAEHDYRLAAESAALDRGEVLPGVNDTTFSGKAPDLGALERQATP